VERFRKELEGAIAAAGAANFRNRIQQAAIRVLVGIVLAVGAIAIWEMGRHVGQSEVAMAPQNRSEVKE